MYAHTNGAYAKKRRTPAEIRAVIYLVVLTGVCIFVAVHVATFVYKHASVAWTQRTAVMLPNHSVIGHDAPTWLRSSHRMQLTHIVLPFFPPQGRKVMANMELWETYPPCDPNGPAHPFNPHVKRPSLVFLVTHQEKDTDAEQEALRVFILDTYATLPQDIRACFGPPVYTTMAIKKEDDTHVNGARLVFEHMLNGATTFLTDAQYILLMEPDLRPIQSEWATAVMLETVWPQSRFWVKGSVFRGSFRILGTSQYLPALYHINGNAIYNIGDHEFREMYFKIRKYVVETHGDSINAYDTDIWEYMFGREQYAEARNLLHLIRYTDIIQNQYFTEYSLAEIQKSSPQTVLVHGGHMNE